MRIVVIAVWFAPLLLGVSTASLFVISVMIALAYLGVWQVLGEDQQQHAFLRELNITITICTLLSAALLMFTINNT